MSPSNPKSGSGESSAERELILTRAFKAPLQLVWKAWTEPERLKQWFGPNGFTVPVCKMDVRSGGAFHFVFRGPDGTEFPADSTYLDVVDQTWIVFRGAIDNVPGHHVLTMITFADRGTETKLTVHQAFSFESDATRGAPIGWGQTLDHLAEYVAKA